MRKIKFTKMAASGNDFVLIDSRKSKVRGVPLLAKNICDRKYGVGADGLLVLERSRSANARMRIFNADGSEAEMCGNGARCCVFYIGRDKTRLETKAGTIESSLKKDIVKIRLTDPKNIRPDLSIKVNNRNLKVNFIDTGVPHAVIFVEGLDEIHVRQIGRAVRNHKVFSPRGTNVDFVEVLNEDSLGIRTYERGVEDETLACGTGSVASAVIFALKIARKNKISVHTKSGEILKVYFKRINNSFRDVWLEGKAKIIHKGEYYV
ncbi:MAG: diaminopimelate epimerase [Candidatus Omnitrophica bacterium]|nr:diaminopimelate epimerase [Candidatus Omnitrophota bacterium]MDD5553664.1 diaminopimelate epimerase [Candidatus Omnitrophota bacterium]